MNLAVGDAVTAASSTANIVVVGPGGFEVTTTVSVDEVTDVKVGQPATFLPDGSKRPLAGTVTVDLDRPGRQRDAPRATASSSGSTDQDANLDNGSTGSVAIVTESARAGARRCRRPRSRRSAAGTR